MKFEDLEKLIGNTPIITIQYKNHNNKGELKTVKAKLEWYNYSGSIKDRPAYYIIKNALRHNLFNIETGIVCATSGNMGISLCAIANLLRSFFIAVMPKGVSEERKNLFKVMGARIVEVDTLDDAVIKARDIAKQEKAYCVEQFEDFNNVMAHVYGLGHEIRQQYYSDGDVVNDCAFVAGMGSCGTLMGVSYVLPGKMRTVAVEPDLARVFTEGRKGYHAIQGLNGSFISKLFNKEMVDGFVRVTDMDVIAMARKLNQHGIPVGLSGAANFLGAVLDGAKVAYTVFPDDNKKYLSTQLSQDIRTELVDKIEIWAVNE